ncbi:Na(+)/H(+) antiporter subunit A [Longibacter salinarum]|uniref:Na(+)/H(+) antiporter subunit A n=1 Tax=Longibacter salinarum TaxID=1850348 RepID=A0A2A8CW89_9BACT|nr:putative monovalent cation/H+ antiporter subunit A [Longibacter salinarum]PEN12854.1 Na(+)/H(+) antiporter subunit A [Longibacter salinarum]
MLLAVLSVFAAAAIAPLVVRLTRKASGWILATVPLGAFVYFLLQAGHVTHEGAIRQSTTWFPAYDLPLSFYLDGLSLLFALLVTGIGTLIVVYAGGYLKHSDELGRFYVQLLSFMGAMLGLVLADNAIVFFIFFELTSLTSYLLIGFYHNEEDSRRAARKALIVTGTGGLALMAGLVLLQQVTGTWEFSEMLAMGDMVSQSPLYLGIFILVCAGAFTKSAQFPFHFWLPAAMAGPTPVSAYLHSATMVKAGVFILARLHPVLGGTEVWTTTLVLFGGFTMVLTAWLALRYTDLKQILAYTTTMVLGLLTMLLGVGTEEAIAAMVTFTLVHALYKGALFMLAGNIDHETGTRDLTELGGLRAAMPITMAGGLAAALSMSGIPPFFGFIGKEITYEAALHGGSWSTLILVASVLANAALVASGLLVGLKPFIGEVKGAFTREPHEAPLSMYLGPCVLGGLGLLLGVYPALVDHGLLQTAQAGIMQETHELHLALWHGVNPALIASLVTFALGFGIYYLWERLHESTAMVGFGRAFADAPGDGFERMLYGLGRGSYSITNALQTGKFRRYLLLIFLGTIVMVGGALIAESSISWPTELGEVRYYEAALAGLIVLSALAAVRAHDRFVAILALSIGGYSVALLYLLFGAPDLAMTQFSVETLTLILLVIVLIHLPNIEGHEPVARRIRDAVVSLGVGAIVTTVAFAALSFPLDRSVSDFMTNNSYTAAQGSNVVNVILVDYRGLDTFGEITVLTMAALGVFVMMRMRRIRLPEILGTRFHSEDVPADGMQKEAELTDAGETPPEDPGPKDESGTEVHPEDEAAEEEETTSDNRS